MKGNYEPDNFTENDVLVALEAAGLKYKAGSRYILSQCPLHDDTNPSVQIYKDDWFVNCHAGCGRFHITKAFPKLQRRDRGGATRNSNNWSESDKNLRSSPKVKEVNYKTFDLMEDWKKMLPIPRDHKFKNIPLEVLDDLGWRYDPNMSGYFIPYFSASKKSIPFAQWRHFTRDRRFTFLKDAKPTMYGTWNLSESKLFLVEGTSDAAVLEHCGVPWVAAPSAASGELVKLLAAYCKKNSITIVFAGDNDSAGFKLREALEQVTSYRVKQPPKEYKDWGDFYEAKGIIAVSDYCVKELGGMVVYDESGTWGEKENKILDNIQKTFSGAKQLKDVGSEGGIVRSNKTAEPTVLF